MNKLLLFDIDSTLIKWSPAHGQAFQEAYHQVYGVEGRLDGNYHGMTDQGIILAVMKRAGLPEAEVMAKLPKAHAVMVKSYERLSSSEHITVLPGVRELLEALVSRGVTLGLVTGNHEQIARLKLAKAGLIKYFTCGGFGSDHINRSHIVTIALGRARELSGFNGHSDSVIVVGDSPLDIAAAHSAGVRGFGVATSIYSVDELKAAGAEVAFADLTDTPAVLHDLGVV